MKRAWMVVSLLAFQGIGSAVTMADINGGDVSGCGVGCFLIGDKEFQGLSVMGVDQSAVNVSGTAVGSDVSIIFGGPFSTTSTSGVDFQIFYDVTSLGGAISAIDQHFTLSSLNTGGVVSVGETVRNGPAPTGTVVAQSTVGFFITGDLDDPPGEPATGDQLNINPPLQRVWVTKDIFLQANGGGLVGATIITQSFHQVPEPAHYALLLCAGMFGLWYKSRKRSQA